MSEEKPLYLVKELSESGAPSKVLYKLCAIGINYVNSSYRSDKEEILKEFGKTSKADISEMWDDLDVQIKCRYIDENATMFKGWLKNA